MTSHIQNSLEKTSRIQKRHSLASFTANFLVSIFYLQINIPSSSLFILFTLRHFLIHLFLSALFAKYIECIILFVHNPAISLCIPHQILPAFITFKTCIMIRVSLRVLDPASSDRLIAAITQHRIRLIHNLSLSAMFLLSALETNKRSIVFLVIFLILINGVIALFAAEAVGM